MILKLISASIVFIILPIILGLGILRFDKKNKNIFLAFILGFLIQWMIFELFAIPMSFCKRTFYELRNIWAIAMLVLATISIIINIKKWKEIIKENIKDILSIPKILGGIALIIILFQSYVSFKYMHEDYDDSNFVAKATIAVDTNTLFVYDDQGLEYKTIPTRHIFSPFPYYTATIATLVGIHPAVMAHTILPVILLVITYDVYYLIGMSLFKNDKNKALTFLIILCFSYIFGAYTRYSVYGRILTRAWQGKSNIVNIILPFIWYLYLEYIGEKKDILYWVILLITLWSSLLLSSMAFTLPIITAGLLTLLYMIKDKKINYAFKFLVCCIPSVIYGIIYLQIK